MSGSELKRENRRAFRVVMREMGANVRFDTPDELEVLRENFTVARKRSLLGLVGGGVSSGLGWRYTMGRPFAPLVAAWGALAGMTIGMFSIRQKMFLDLLSIPEDRSPFARQARGILEKEMPGSLLFDEIARRRRELYPRVDDSYEDVVWTEPPPSSVDQFTDIEDFDSAGRHAKGRKQSPWPEK